MAESLGISMAYEREGGIIERPLPCPPGPLGDPTFSTCANLGTLHAPLAENGPNGCDIITC
jgi:hypothetical protein